MSPSAQYGLACLPEYLPWLKTNDAHKHTWRRESMLLSQRLQSGMIIAHTICLQSSQCILISSLLPYLSLTRFLAFSPSLQTAESSLPRFKTTRPFWSLNRSFCFLFLSRWKRLSSAHYKRSQHSGAMLATPGRKKNAEADLAGKNYWWPFTTNSLTGGASLNCPF